MSEGKGGNRGLQMSDALKIDTSWPNLTGKSQVAVVIVIGTAAGIGSSLCNNTAIS
jgi:hypothetical protein